MKKTLLIFSVLTAFIISSCKKSGNAPDTDKTTTSINDIKVPAGFNWESARDINITVSVTDNRFKDAVHQITIYNGDPFSGGVELSQGSAGINSPFTTKIYLANTITELYVVKTAPDKSKIVQKVKADKTDIAVTIGATDPTVITNSSLSNGLKVQDAAPVTDCNSGCTLPVITTNKSDIDLNNGDVLCITGSNITVNLRNLNGGTIRVCGANVTLQNLNLAGSTTLLVSASGSVNLSSINFNSSSASIINYGTIHVAASFPDNGIFSNHGLFTCGADFNLNSQAGVFTNNGTINVGGSLNDGTPAVATNNGTITVGGNFQPNSSSKFVNNCTLTIGGNYNNSGNVKNYSLITVGGISTINGNSELGLYNGAMLKTANLIVDGSIVGYGSTSLVKITSTTNIRNQGSVIHNVQVYAVNGMGASSAGHIGNGATQDHTVYIPQTGCNGEGNGTPTVTDSDHDGVADNLDDYPNDATKAYNVNGATGTLAFEDQWPCVGDYDLNDFVMGYSYALITNAANKVVHVSGNYTLLASGGTLNNGFGMQFPVSPLKVKNIKITNRFGKEDISYVEGIDNDNNVSIMLFGNMREQMGNDWNTIVGEHYGTPPTYKISFDITDGPTLEAFGLDAYNPYIFNGTRGHEIHLPGKTPTGAADPSLFSTCSDATYPAAGRYYVTRDGYPYALNIPVASFQYPDENVDIVFAYPHFADWAQSGGTAYTDWYSNTASGYRDLDKIYHH